MDKHLDITKEQWALRNQIRLEFITKVPIIIVFIVSIVIYSKYKNYENNLLNILNKSFT